MIFELTDHAIERYQERVRPGLSYDAAAAELHHMLNTVAQVGLKPSWVHSHYSQLPDERRGDSWLYLGPDLVVACERQRQGIYRAVTVLCRGHISALTRARRKADRVYRQGTRRGQRTGTRDARDRDA